MQNPIRIELPTIFEMKTVNAYLFLEPEPILIDCGENTDKTWQVLEENLAKHNLKIADIKKVYITHAHVDHIGMAGRIAEYSQAEIWIADYAKEWVFNFEVMDRRTMEITKNDITFVDFPKDSPIAKMLDYSFSAFLKYWSKIPQNAIHIFNIGDKLNFGNQDWEVIHAPGHCIHQVCFYQKDTKALLSADMLLSITPSPITDISLEPPYKREKSLLQLIESFHKFKAMDIDMVYPGHYEPFNNHKELITNQLERIEKRKTQCLELIQSGQTSFYELLQVMYEPKWMVVGFAMLIGYLDLLQDEGLIELREIKGKVGFYAIESIRV